MWQAAYDDKERCNTYVVPILYVEKGSDGTIVE